MSGYHYSICADFRIVFEYVGLYVSGIHTIHISGLLVVV